MRIKEELKESGYFWLPSVPDQQIPGILSISDGGEIKLELFGMFGTFDDNSKQIERVVGHVEEMGFVTLDGCYYRTRSSRIDTSRTFGSILKSSFDVTRVFTGVAYREGEIPCFNTLTFSIEQIDEWVGISGIEVDPQFGDSAVTISYELPENIPLKLDNGMELLIAFSWPPPISFASKEAKIVEKINLHLISQDTRELEEFISIAEKISTFLCFVANEVVSLDSVSTIFDAFHQDVRKGLTKMTSVNIYSHSWPYSKNEPIGWFDMLFEFKEVRDNIDRVINNWIKSFEQFSPAFRLYLEAQMKTYPYLEAKFLTLAQGLEIYHRRASDEKEMDEAEFEALVVNLIEHCPEERTEWLRGKLKYGNEVSLRKRIKRLIEPFKDLFGNKGKRKKLINGIVDTRNYLTHHSSVSEDVEDLWTLCEKMEALFQLHFLQLIGFSPEEIRSIECNCKELRWKLQSRLQTENKPYVFSNHKHPKIL